MLGWMSINPKTNMSQYFGSLAKPSPRKNHASRDPSVEHQDTLLRDGRSQASTQGARRVLRTEFLASPEDVRRRPKYLSGSVRLVASCIKEVIRLYDLTKFEGNLQTPQAFLKGIPWQSRTVPTRHYFRTRALIGTFLHDHKIKMQGLKQMADSILSELVAENRGQVKETTRISHQALCMRYKL
jgi:hypothetical protein